MKILVVGSGGREHALAWKLAQEADVLCAPGNPGIAEECECRPVATDDAAGMLALCGSFQPDCVVIGPEAPLIAGLGDHLRAGGFFVVGPGADGARMEGSKAFSKAAMAAANIPTASFETFVDPLKAHAYVRARYQAGEQVVVKASGEALGKGVLMCPTLKEAQDAVERTMVQREFGDAGATVVIERRLEGREFSLLTLCSDGSYWSLPVAQDYKRAHDGDEGPNTGGMGTTSPLSWVGPALVQKTEERVVAPLLRYLASRGIAYRGVLFSGLMLVDGNPYCLEYNVRFGDPEIQSVVMRLGAGLAEAMVAVARGRSIPEVPVARPAAVSVVVASRGYPGAVEKGVPITLPSIGDGKLFHSGTAMRDGVLVTNGGRVLCASAAGDTLEQARASAYGLARGVEFEGAWMRSDIAGAGSR
ncbi:MAG: phosphoribosylamine--glycine ligase [Fimbriimonadaceae bacterium]|nr:phosphoribosylamine--glycine ligase [Chthonomonadaceae bacterium]MCO5296881.1 phosphoribosylamine--glycine ligase [Fimbriimonadaceae bacterium]